MVLVMKNVLTSVENNLIVLVSTFGLKVWIASYFLMKTILEMVPKKKNVSSTTILSMKKNTQMKNG